MMVLIELDVVELNKRGKRFYLSMERAYPGFTDTVAVSALVHQLESTPLSERVKKKIMGEINRMRVERIEEYFQVKRSNKGSHNR